MKNNPIYNLFGMGMQRVDAERMERLEPSPLCFIETQSGED